ncbi:MAG: AmmeMemoRadiSam system protein A [Firmicutes bacterium]|nr:AmmeMemoRadiSam system protein A [Bacillota bacterium]
MPLLQAFVVPHPPIIIPEIGKGEERKIQDTINAYKKISRIIKELNPDTIIISTPHGSLYSKDFYLAGGELGIGGFANFGAEHILFKVDYDRKLTKAIVEQAKIADVSTKVGDNNFDVMDHGTLVPLYFINKEFKDYKLVRIALSAQTSDSHYKFGECIRKAIDESDERIVYIASGDLSHVLKKDGPYGFNKEGPIFDKIVTEALSKGDWQSLLNIDESFCGMAAECGLRSFLIMAGVLGSDKIKAELLSYEGPFGVGYAIASFTPIFSEDIVMENDNLKMDPYVKLAMDSLEYFMKNGEYMSVPEGLQEELYQKKAGVFVSLKIDGELRGCIGTIKGVTNSIAQEIIRNAVSAGINDPRFYPVSLKELEVLDYSVDVLGSSFPVNNIDELDAKRFGVIVSSGGRRGLLLPNLDGVNTPREQIDIALQKAGIGPEEDYELDAFEVVRHK